MSARIASEFSTMHVNLICPVVNKNVSTCCIPYV